MSAFQSSLVAAFLAGPFLWQGISRAEEMVFPTDEWQRASPESQMVSPTLLGEAVDYLSSALPSGTGVDSLLIARNGHIVWEGPTIDHQHSVLSVTKSFVTTVLGMLVEDQLLDMESSVSDYVPELARRHSDVTIGHLANMTSNAGSSWNPPGSQFQYSNQTFDTLSQAMRTASETSLFDIFAARIGGPIGIEQMSWKTKGTVEGVDVNSGGAGISISSEDAARFGHLFLNGGHWNGNRLLSSDWVSSATSVQVGLDVPLNDNSETPWGPGVYGYGWWVNALEPDETFALPGAPEGMYMAAGARNNYIFVIPHWELVISRTSSSNEPFEPLATWGEFIRLVGVAVDSVRPGDANLDGKVDFLDFVILANHFGQVGEWSHGDFDGSGDVQFADFVLLSDNFDNSSRLQGVVPEPAASVPVLLGLLFIVARRVSSRRAG